MPEAPDDAADRDDEAVAVERAMAALEAQRASLGDAVVDAALGPLRRRRDELLAGSQQRRQVTVLFADLVDFTGMSERLDPEDVRAVVDRYFDVWLREVAAEGGEVEKFIGDAVMAVFGLRRAEDDDAPRAVRAALRALAGLGELNDALEQEHGVRLAARAGIDTGEVVVSTLGDRDGAGYVAVGPAVNRASRLQAAAEPGRVVVSPSTRALLGGAFLLEPLGELRLKGVDEPVAASAVRAELRSGFHLEPGSGPTVGTVGRERERAALDRHVAEVERGAGYRVVTLVGEAGLGKTRLLFDLDARLAERPEDVWYFRGRASAASRGVPGALLRDVLGARAGVTLDDPREVVRRRFEEAFAAALGPAEGPPAGRLVATWLRFLPPSTEVPSDSMALRDRATEALGAYLGALARWGSVVLLLEDLHWADEESLRWLDAAAPVLGDRPVLVVASARPALLEDRPGWGASGHHARVDLAPLPRSDGRALVTGLLARLPVVPERLVDRLLDAGGGNPYYLGELVGWLLDSGVVVREGPAWRLDEARVGEVAVPATLRGVLQSRLDALPAPERALLRRVSVLGRVFWDGAAAALGPGAGDPAPLLDRLLERGTLLEREGSRFAGTRELVFQHALLRDVAYEGVLRRDRAGLHRGAARWLERAGADRAEELAPVIADHLERAGDPSAPSWYLRAAAQAAAVHALREAEQLLDGAERTARGDPGVRFDVGLAREELLDRAADRDGQGRQLDLLDQLAGEVGDERNLRRVLAWARWAFLQSEYRVALDAAAEAAGLAESARLPEAAAEALLIEGKSRTWQDEAPEARALLDRAVLSGVPAVAAEATRYLCILAGNVGDLPSALEHGAAARAMFHALGDAEMEAMAHAQTATALYRGGRYAEAQQVLEEAVPIFRRSGHRYRELMAMANLASVASARGDRATAIRTAGGALPQLRVLGDREATTVALITVGTAHLLTGERAGAEAELGEALAIAEELRSAPLAAGVQVRLVLASLLHGDPEAAVDAGRRAVEAAGGAAGVLERCSALLMLGHALLAADEPVEAEGVFLAAGDDAVVIGVEELRREAVVGAAAARSAAGDAAGAVTLLEPVLEASIAPDGLVGVLLPGLTLLEAVEVLDRAGDARAGAVRAAAAAVVTDLAGVAGDVELTAEYLALPPHVALLRP